jgi:hypothetical protein
MPWLRSGHGKDAEIEFQHQPEWGTKNKIDAFDFLSFLSKYCPVMEAGCQCPLLWQQANSDGLLPGIHHRIISGGGYFYTLAVFSQPLK